MNTSSTKLTAKERELLAGQQRAAISTRWAETVWCGREMRTLPVEVQYLFLIALIRKEKPPEFDPSENIDVTPAQAEKRAKGKVESKVGAGAGMVLAGGVGKMAFEWANRNGEQRAKRPERMQLVLSVIYAIGVERFAKLPRLELKSKTIKAKDIDGSLTVGYIMPEKDKSGKLREVTVVFLVGMDGENNKRHVGLFYPDPSLIAWQSQAAGGGSMGPIPKWDFIGYNGDWKNYGPFLEMIKQAADRQLGPATS